MAPLQFTADTVSVVQQKTRKPITIPLLAELKEALAATKVTGKETVLVTGGGRPFSEKYFYNWLKVACDKAGIPHCRPHGMRRSAARRLSEAGCSVHEIAAITGHASLQEVQRYAKEADQKRLAGRAFEKLTGTSKEQTT